MIVTTRSHAGNGDGDGVHHMPACQNTVVFRRVSRPTTCWDIVPQAASVDFVGNKQGLRRLLPNPCVKVSV
jgi:hypothetical protein